MTHELRPSISIKLTTNLELGMALLTMTSQSLSQDKKAEIGTGRTINPVQCTLTSPECMKIKNVLAEMLVMLFQA